MSQIRVDFAFGAPDRLRTACEVVRKHYLRQRRVIIYIADSRQRTRFSHMLWGFESTAFVPHVNADDPLVDQTPIVLCDQMPRPDLTRAGTEPAWLLNLSTQCPPNTETFLRILEIVSNDEADKQAARTRWRHYQQQGYQVHAHQIG